MSNGDETFQNEELDQDDLELLDEEDVGEIDEDDYNEDS